MKLLRHLLSHLLLIIILFGIVSLYYYRYQIIPDTYTKTMDTYADKIHPALKLFARNTKQETPNKVDVIKVAVVKVPVVKIPEKNNLVVESTDKKAESNEEETTVIQEIVENGQKPSVDEKKNTSTDISVADVEGLLNKTKDSSSEKQPVQAPVLDVVEKETAEENIEITDKDSDSTQDLLRAARVAFNKGDIAASIKNYQALIELDNDEADFHGELGNVFYAKGDWANAGIEYYEAATRLIEQKQYAQVGYLQRVIQGLDPERAEKLANELKNK